MYPKNDLNVHGYKPTKLKFVLSTYSSTRIKFIHIYVYADKGFAPFSFRYELKMLTIYTNPRFKAKVTRTLIVTVMSSMLYQLSYSLAYYSSLTVPLL